MSEKKTLLVGVGNPLSGDDGFGPLLLKHLREAGNLPRSVSLVDAGTDLLNHIESFAEYDRVVLLDAIIDPVRKLGPPGRVAVLQEQSFLSWSDTAQGVHQISTLVGIKLFRLLNPEARVEIHLVGLFVDRLSYCPVYMTDERIQEAVAVIRDLL